MIPTPIITDPGTLPTTETSTKPVPYLQLGVPTRTSELALPTIGGLMSSSELLHLIGRGQPRSYERFNG